MKLSHFHVSLPKLGEKLSGDTVVIREEDGVAFLCVIDALGHGPAAAEVADRGRAFLSTVPLTKSVLAITEGLHGALRGTRGAAAMCCVLRSRRDDGQSLPRVEGCGVGNVELRVLSSRVPVILTPGILGVSLHRTRVFEGPLAAGARLVMFSDGISPRMELDKYERLPVEHACKAMVERYRRSHDDATLLLADVEAS